MPRNDYEQDEFIMDGTIEKLINDAEVAFNTLFNVVGEFQKNNQIPPLADSGDENDVEEFAAADADDLVEASYFGRPPVGGAGCGGFKCGCGCGCKCGCPKPVDQYPCECRICDKLKAKADTNFVLGINDLSDAFDLLKLAKHKFKDAVDSLQDAARFHDKARRCAIKFGCKYYCRSRFGCHRFPR